MAGVRVTVKLNNRSVRSMGNSEGVFRELERRARRVKELAEASAPVDTGEYKRSFRLERTRVRGMAAVQVVNDSPVSMIVEFGTRPHVIEPRTKQALAWPGGRHPVKKVNHPGTPAFHVLRNALRAAGR